jgi:multidrug efflux pump subunit AcrA (membrane-fusion protein)
VIVRLVKPGTRVKRGDLLIEFDRQAQIKTAHDRQAEYRDFVEQINKKRGEQITASAHGEAELKTAENAVKSAGARDPQGRGCPSDHGGAEPADARRSARQGSAAPAHVRACAGRPMPRISARSRFSAIAP